MRIVLDTGVLWRPDALRRLAQLPNDVIVPAIVYTERARQILRDGRSIEELDSALQANEFTVEAYSAEQATRYAVQIQDDNDWIRLARDAMIAGHVRDADLLWTTNPDDFEELGVPDEQILPVG